jgi:hypothetical protein
MPDFHQLFPPQDPDLLRIVAGFWHLDLRGENPHAWAEQISAAMQDPTARAEMLETLPPQSIAAFQSMVSGKGKRPWPEFAREFGEIREMGAGKRDRERPHENPASISEALHYRGLIGRVFLPEGGVLSEFVCIPAELLPEGEKGGKTIGILFGKPAAPDMHVFVQPASDLILDHATVLLAALRSGIPIRSLADREWSAGIPFLLSLLTAAGIVDSNTSPHPEKTRAFLAASRPEALSLLITCWLESPAITEWKFLPGITLSGIWGADPLRTRRMILDLFTALPRQTWWDLESFISAVRSRQPDIMREGGDYDRWYVRDEQGTEFRGFDSWMKVEGSLLRFFVSLLNGFGLADLGSTSPNEPAGIFRLCADFEDRLAGKSVFHSPKENGRIAVTSTGQILVAPFAPRVAHYQLARYCQWGKEDQRGCRYRITSSSLAYAREQGLSAKKLPAVLESVGASPTPPSLLNFIQNWEKFGPQARFDRAVLLRVTRAGILDELLASPAASSLGERLNPETILVKPGKEQQVLDQLARLGHLAESRLDV